MPPPAWPPRKAPRSSHSRLSHVCCPRTECCENPGQGRTSRAFGPFLAFTAEAKLRRGLWGTKGTSKKTLAARNYFLAARVSVSVESISICFNRFQYNRNFQVTYIIASPQTQEREFSALEAIPDNYPKTVLSLDEFPRSRNGIQGVNLIDWLLE